MAPVSNSKQMRKYGGTLRPYQKEGVAEVRKSLANGPTLLVSPTGGGKTDMAAVIAEVGYRTVLFVGHRRELLAQALKKVGVHVVCMSIQRALRHGPKKVDLLIIDEAHRASAKTYRMLIEKYSTASRLGLTATPLRTDGQGLCDAFSYMVQVSSVKELVEDGWLVPCLPPLGPGEEALAHLARLKKLKKKGNDYDPAALAELVNTPRLVGQVVTEYLLHAKDRKAIVFAVNVAHSKALEAEFKNHNVRAIHLDSKSSASDRDAALQQLANKEIDVLCNVDLFTEGWDCPSVSNVIMARPTMSIALHLQCLGRGMRHDPASGKQNLLIIDHAGNIARHGMPDEDRGWALESRAQREKREKREAAEKGGRDLGFESLTQYRLEQQRLIESTYPWATIIKKLYRYKSQTGIRQVLRRLNINRAFGNGNKVRYNKSDIDGLVEILDKTYSAGDANRVLAEAGIERSKSGGVTSSVLFRKTGMTPVTGFSSRYWRSDIDTLASKFANSYSSADCQEILGVGKEIVGWLRSFGLNPFFGFRYLKTDIEKLHNPRPRSLCSECGGQFNGPRGLGVHRFRKHGVVGDVDGFNPSPECTDSVFVEAR